MLGQIWEDWQVAAGDAFVLGQHYLLLRGHEFCTDDSYVLFVKSEDRSFVACKIEVMRPWIEQGRRVGFDEASCLDLA